MHPHVFTPKRETGCQAYAKSTKAQCRRPGQRYRYCNSSGHAQQEGKCRAITRSAKRCLGSISVAGRGYFCQTHEGWATPDEKPCAGMKVLDGPKCYRRVDDPEYKFCSTKHDLDANYCNPELFRQIGLRDRMLPELMSNDVCRDRYNPEVTDLLSVSECQVDHIGEVQIAAFICQFDIFLDTEEKNDVVQFYRDEVVNKLFNLCLTLMSTNQRKGLAVTNSLEDMMKFSLSEYGRPDERALVAIRAASFDVPIVANFDDRLLSEGLGRDSTRVIRQEMGQALHKWQYKCLDQGDSPIYGMVGGLTQKIFVALDLHVADL